MSWKDHVLRLEMPFHSCVLFLLLCVGGVDANGERDDDPTSLTMTATLLASVGLSSAAIVLVVCCAFFRRRRQQEGITYKIEESAGYAEMQELPAFTLKDETRQESIEPNGLYPNPRGIRSGEITIGGDLAAEEIVRPQMNRRTNSQTSFANSETDLVEAVTLIGEDDSGPGFTIEGNSSDGIFVKEVLAKGPAKKSNRVQQGDQIVSLAISMANMSLDHAEILLELAKFYPIELHLTKRSPNVVLQAAPSQTEVDRLQSSFTEDLQELGRSRSATCLKSKNQHQVMMTMNFDRPSSSYNKLPLTSELSTKWRYENRPNADSRAPSAADGNGAHSDADDTGAHSDADDISAHSDADDNGAHSDADDKAKEMIRTSYKIGKEAEFPTDSYPSLGVLENEEPLAEPTWSDFKLELPALDVASQFQSSNSLFGALSKQNPETRTNAQINEKGADFKFSKSEMEAEEAEGKSHAEKGEEKLSSGKQFSFHSNYLLQAPADHDQVQEIRGKIQFLDNDADTLTKLAMYEKKLELNEDDEESQEILGTHPYQAKIGADRRGLSSNVKTELGGNKGCFPDKDTEYEKEFLREDVPTKLFGSFPRTDAVDGEEMKKQEDALFCSASEDGTMESPFSTGMTLVQPSSLQVDPVPLEGKTDLGEILTLSHSMKVEHDDLEKGRSFCPSLEVLSSPSEPGPESEFMPVGQKVECHQHFQELAATELSKDIATLDAVHLTVFKDEDEETEAVPYGRKENKENLEKAAAPAAVAGNLSTEGIQLESGDSSPDIVVRGSQPSSPEMKESKQKAINIGEMIKGIFSPKKGGKGTGKAEDEATALYYGHPMVSRVSAGVTPTGNNHMEKESHPFISRTSITKALNGSNSVNAELSLTDTIGPSVLITENGQKDELFSSLGSTQSWDSRHYDDDNKKASRILEIPSDGKETPRLESEVLSSTFKQQPPTGNDSEALTGKTEEQELRPGEAEAEMPGFVFGENDFDEFYYGMVFYGKEKIQGKGREEEEEEGREDDKTRPRTETKNSDIDTETKANGMTHHEVSMEDESQNSPSTTPPIHPKWNSVEFPEARLSKELAPTSVNGYSSPNDRLISSQNTNSSEKHVTTSDSLDAFEFFDLRKLSLEPLELPWDTLGFPKTQQNGHSDRVETKSSGSNPAEFPLGKIIISRSEIKTEDTNNNLTIESSNA